MKLLNLKKVRDGKYLKDYELTYENKAGKKKIYEIVSLKELSEPKDLGTAVTGVSIAAVHEGKLLLLKEFRMAINCEIYGLCAGHLEENESVEECIQRELYEETGLNLKRIIKIFPPSFSTVTISDAKTQIAFVEVEGMISGEYMSANEQIKAAFYTPQEVLKLIETETFSSRAQMIAYGFAQGLFRA